MFDKNKSLKASSQQKNQRSQLAESYMHAVLLFFCCCLFVVGTQASVSLLSDGSDELRSKSTRGCNFEQNAVGTVKDGRAV